MAHTIAWPIDVEENKYSRWYEALISSAKNRTLPPDTYVERHHVLPHCMGGKKDDQNMVVLLAREHYIAHLLLWKMKMPIKWHNKMTMALHVMVNGSGNQKQGRSYLVPSRIYESCRIEYVRLTKERMLGPENPWRGKTHSPESIEKIKEANARTKDIRSAKLKGPNNPMYGKTHSEEMRKQISASAAAAWSEEDKRKKSEWMKAKFSDPEFKAAFQKTREESEGWKNRDWKAIARKSADTRIANGWKPSEEDKKKMSETRRAKLASGEIVPWNKGKKIGCYKTPEQCKASAAKAVETKKKNGTQVKMFGADNPFYGKKHSEETKTRIKATKEAKKANGWVNPMKGRPANPDAIEKAKATKAAKKAAGFKRKPGPPMTQETIEKIKATKAARREAKLKGKNDGNPVT